MPLHSDDGKGKVELAPCDAEPIGYPSLCFNAIVTTPEVTGRRDELWFELATMEQFIRGIVSLNECSKIMSPNQHLR